MKELHLAKSLMLAANLLLQLICVRSHAGAGDVDLSFNPGAGLSGQVHAAALQSDGKVIVAGEFGVARLNADGGRDRTFRQNSAIAVSAYALFLQPDGKVVAGHQRGINRLNSDGSADTNFIVTIDLAEGSAVYAIAVQPDGKVVMGGTFVSINGVFRPGIGRLNTDGSRDTNFDSVVSGTVAALVLQSDGKVLLGGRLTTPAGNKCLIRLNADGTLDGTFTTFANADDVVLSVAVQADGKIVAGGYFSIGGHNHIVRLNENGAVDPAFQAEAAANNTVFSVRLQSDGKLLSAGGFTEMNGASRQSLARLNADGSLDDTFNPGTNFSAQLLIQSLVVQPDGKLLIAGSFTEFGGLPRQGFARLESNGALDVAFNANGGINGAVDSLLVQPDGKVLISGDFTSVNGASRYGIARLNHDGSLDATVFHRGVLGSVGRVTAVALQADGKVLIGSELGLARTHADGTSDSNFVANIGTGDQRSAVTSLAVQADGKIVVGGYGATDVVDPNEGTVIPWNRLHLTRLNADGRHDTTFQRTLEELVPNDRYFVQALAVQPDGKVLVAGYFFSFKGTNHVGIARVNSDGTLDTGFNVGANNYVTSLALRPDGKLFIGGAFTFVNGTNRRRVARVHPDGGLDASWNPGTGAENAIRAIALQSDGKLLVAGSFNTINGTGRQRIARLNADGGLDDSFLAFPEPEYVHSLTLQLDGKVLMGGSFNVVNGTVSPRVARLYGGSFLLPPSLSIGHSNAFVIVSWPMTAASVQLQETTNLSLANSWSLVGQASVTNGNLVSVSIPTTSANKFFRLNAP